MGKKTLYTILIITDDSKSLSILRDSIRMHTGASIVGADSEEDCLKVLSDENVDLVILDMQIEKLDCIEIYSAIMAKKGSHDIPVIFLTDVHAKDEFKKRGHKTGAVDYLIKPVDEFQLINRINIYLKFIENERLMKYTLKNQEKLMEMAMKDSLTDVYNRAFMKELFEKIIAKQERKGIVVSLAIADIDRFKSINDIYGHYAGDMILKEVSAILCATVRKSDVIGRYGGDEFCIMMPETGYQDVYDISERMRKNVEEYSFKIEDEIISITISIGVCYKGSNSNADYNEMIKMADEALYTAKRDGRNRIEMSFVGVNVLK